MSDRVWEPKRIELTQELVERMEKRYDAVDALPQWKAVAPRRNLSMLARILLQEFLDELDDLEEDAGGTKAFHALISDQGTLFVAIEEEASTGKQQELPLGDDKREGGG